MVFSSLIFLFRFLPVFLLVYYIAPKSVKNLVLFIGSLIFYAWGEPRYSVLVLMSILVNFYATRFMSVYDREYRIRERRICLFFIIFYNVGMLLFFKYTGFILTNINTFAGTDIPVPKITLPLGISFYTFQIMSYVIDVYKGEIEVENSILNLGTYLVMFPQLIAGPIVVYKDVAAALKEREITLQGVENGLMTFTLGLGSKVILANNLGNIWNACGEAGYENISTLFAWLGIAAYTMQLYFDFSGYSLMAIGLGEMMGFKFPQNFNFPYSANSVSEFWKRWHMTLTNWFRNYIYIPLGGNRKGAVRTYFNMFVVWLITGFWHGADWNFILWGLYYFVLLSIERLFLKKILDQSQFFSRIYTLLAVMVGWVLFAAPSLYEAVIYLSRMFTLNPGTDFLEYARNYALLLAGGVIFATPVFSDWYKKHRRNIVVLLFMIAVFWYSVYLLTEEMFNPFLYFRF
ncbi:alginate O-acetyltransferase complex protein AlgI [Lachnospiraceae bacterium]|nr:alginate O-acetyltransferase complex protein AlgI [Lachnospiraceae bacterium]